MCTYMLLACLFDPNYKKIFFFFKYVKLEALPITGFQLKPDSWSKIATNQNISLIVPNCLGQKLSFSIFGTIGAPTRLH